MKIFGPAVFLVFVLSMQPLCVAMPLNADLSAAAAGVGCAVTADSAGVKALDYNPAGLGQSSQYEIQFSHLAWIFGTSYDKVAVALPVLKGGLGVSAWLFHPFFDNNNSLYKLGQDTGTFHFYDLTATAGYGITVTHGLSAGATVNFIQNSVQGDSVDAFALSTGLAYQMNIPFPWSTSAADSSLLEKGNLRFGLSGHNIKLGGNAEIDHTILRGGVSVTPIPYLKVSADTWMNTGENPTVDTAVGLEGRYMTGKGGGFLRCGIQIPDGGLFAGLGIQGNYARNFYRLDYAYNVSTDPDISSAIKGTSWFSLTIGRLPQLLNTIFSKALFLSPSLFDRKDTFVEKSSAQAKLATNSRHFKVFVESVVSQDEYIKAKQYDLQLKTDLKDRLEKAGLLAKNIAEADLVLGSTMKSEGELLLVSLTGSEPASRAQLVKNGFEVNIKFQREALSKSEILSLGLQEESGKLTFVREKEAEEADEEAKKIDLLSDGMSDWVGKNLKDALSSEWIANANSPDVDVYVDGIFSGKTAKNGNLVLSLVKGKHSLSFIKENYSRVSRQADVSPGRAGRTEAVLEANVFFADLDIKTFPGKARVLLDGKFAGLSPIVITNVKNGPHQISYEFDNAKWSEQVNVAREGVYKLTSLRKFTDLFKKLDSSFWDVASQEDGYQVSFKNHLTIEGTSSDDVWGGAGLVSRSFTMNDLNMKADIKLPDGKQKIMLGVFDAKGHGIAASGNSQNFQLVRLGEESAQAVPTLPFPGKKSGCRLSFRWKRDGTLNISVDESSLISEKLRTEMEGPVRIFLLSDADKINEKGGVEIDDISIQN